MFLLLLVLSSVQMLVYEYMENGTLRDNISGMFCFFTESFSAACSLCGSGKTTHHCSLFLVLMSLRMKYKQHR